MNSLLLIIWVKSTSQWRRIGWLRHRHFLCNLIWCKKCSNWCKKWCLTLKQNCNVTETRCQVAWFVCNSLTARFVYKLAVKKLLKFTWELCHPGNATRQGFCVIANIVTTAVTDARLWSLLAATTIILLSHEPVFAKIVVCLATLCVEFSSVELLV